MAIRDIVKDTEPRLRQQSRVVTEINDHIFTLLDDMKETMLQADGTGIAAPQVGVLRRVIVCMLEDGTVIDMINPVILKKSGSSLREEGCLSVPNRREEVERPSKIKIRYQNRQGEYVTKIYEEFNARVCCHECDHLDGILFYDRAKKK